MRSYGQYCPVARAAEVLGDRWTLLIVREMTFGVGRFNELQRCLPGISRSVLAQRLRHLCNLGLVEREAGGGPGSSSYRLTPAGRSLQPVLSSLGDWAATWAFTDPDPGSLDPDLLMRWISRHVDAQQLPQRRTVVRFDMSGPRRRYWLVLQPEDVSVCLHQPGFDDDVVLAASVATLYDIYFGRHELRAAMRAGVVTVDGARTLVRALPRWFTWSSFAPAIARAAPAATDPAGSRSR